MHSALLNPRSQSLLSVSSPRTSNTEPPSTIVAPASTVASVALFTSSRISSFRREPKQAMTSVRAKVESTLLDFGGSPISRDSDREGTGRALKPRRAQQSLATSQVRVEAAWFDRDGVGLNLVGAFA